MRYLWLILIECGILAISTPVRAQIPPPQDPLAQSKALTARRDAILDAERTRLAAIGIQEPSITRSADGSSRFVPLAEVVAAPVRGLANVRASKPERDSIRLESAKPLFDLATKAANGPSPAFSFADECLRLVLDRQSDHAEARRVLGFIPRDGGWATPFAAENLDKGWVLDPTYGWVQGDWPAHLNRGELPGRKGTKAWLPVAEADALRGDMDNGWQISTEHFEIKTNVPLHDAISFGRKLEGLHQVFFSLMADVIGPDQLPLAARFKNPAVKPTVSKKAKHRVMYFATRDQFARYLAPRDPGADKSLGLYIPKKVSKEFGGISYFFNDVGGQIDVSSTLYHEASHQLLFESAGPTNYDRNVGNYWVFEGLGTYFETLQVQPDGSLRIGGLVGPRIDQAQIRLLKRHEFVPIEQFVTMNKARFQADQGGGDIYLHYAQAMALVVFLMQARDGAYREGFLDYVRDAYKGLLRGTSGRPLEDRVGREYPEMNREFLEYLGTNFKPRP